MCIGVDPSPYYANTPFQMPQLRNTAERFISRVIPDMGMAIRTRPLEALIISAYVRGLSDRFHRSASHDRSLGRTLPTSD